MMMTAVSKMDFTMDCNIFLAIHLKVDLLLSNQWTDAIIWSVR